MYCKSRCLMWTTLLTCACLAILMILWQKVQLEHKPGCQLGRRSRCWQISTVQRGLKLFTFYKGFDRYYDKKDLIMSAKERQITDLLSNVSHEMGAGNSLLKQMTTTFSLRFKNLILLLSLWISVMSKNSMQGCDGNTLLLWGLILIAFICCAQKKRKLLEILHTEICKLIKRNPKYAVDFKME